MGGWFGRGRIESGVLIQCFSTCEIQGEDRLYIKRRPEFDKLWVNIHI
jgi:hypothetical protein